MKDASPIPEEKSGLAAISDIFRNGLEVGADVIESLGYFAQSTFNFVDSRPEALAFLADRLTWFWWSAAVKYRFEMLWVPPQRYRKCPERSGTSSPLNRVVLNLMNDSPGYLRAFCQLALGPTKFFYPLVDGSGDSCPVVHTFLRAPPSHRG